MKPKLRTYGYPHCWDSQYVYDLMKKECDEVFEEIPSGDGVLIINKEMRIMGEIQTQIDKLDKVLIIVIADEERKFNFTELQHPNMIVWCGYAKGRDNPDKLIGCYPYLLASDWIRKFYYDIPKTDWFFSGQIGSKRNVCFEELSKLKNGVFYTNRLFNNGRLDKKSYFRQMCDSRVIPCPAGPECPDSFRFFESLECQCIPVVQSDAYWNRLFPDGFPFPTVKKWKDFPDIVKKYKNDLEFLKKSNECTAFWFKEKRKLLNEFKDFFGIPLDDFTVIITSAYIPSHPDTKILMDTIKSVRERTSAEIIVNFDQIRYELKDKEYDYQLFIRRVMKEFIDMNVLPIINEVWEHQANSTRIMLDYVNTRQVLFMEHDTPLTREIPFDDLVQVVDCSGVNTIRLHYDYRIHPEHEYLMLDRLEIVDVPLIHTRQWSQRPHLAKTSWYKNMLNKFFPPSCRTLIEDHYYSIVARELDGGHYIYAPVGNMQRSLHTDGRAGINKFEMRYK